MSPTQLPGLAPLARSPTNPGRARSGPPSPPPCCHQPGRRHRRPLPGGTPDPAAPRRTATASPAGPPGRRCRPRLPTTREARQEPAAEGWGAERAGSLRAAGGRTGVGGRTGREVTSQGGQGGGPGRGAAKATHPHPGRRGWWRRAASRGRGRGAARPPLPAARRRSNEPSAEQPLLPAAVPPPPAPPRAAAPAPLAQHAGKRAGPAAT